MAQADIDAAQSQEREKQIIERISAGLTSAQERRKSGRNGWSLDNWVQYWRAMATNPDNQWYDNQQVRADGQLNSIQGDEPEFMFSINYIAQELLNMVASDLLNPFRFRCRFGFFNPDVPLTIPGMQGMEFTTADAYQDRVKDVIADFLGRKHLNLNDARLRLYLLRYMEGSAYLTLDWDVDGGSAYLLPKRKITGENGEEKWDVVGGTWSRDGQYFVIPQDKQPALQVPVAEFRKGESYREDVITQGEPRLGVYNLTQVWWDLEPGEISTARIRGVYLVDLVAEEQIKKDYGQAIIYGQATDITYDDLMAQPVGPGTAFFNKLKDMFGLGTQATKPGGKKPLPRVRYRRFPNVVEGERRSQWFTIVGNRLVRAMDCPYGRSFDVSLGIYPFFDRPSPDNIEGIPSVAYMMQQQKVCNATDSLVYSFIESFPYGTYTAVGGGEAKTNVTGGSGPKVISSDRQLNPIQPTPLGPEVFNLKNDMRYMIQYFGRANQLAQGSRSQDLGTATQASIQQQYGQKMTSFTQVNDASSWSMFLNDLLTLLGDGRFVKERRQINSVQTRMVMGQNGQMVPIQYVVKFDFMAPLLNYVDSIVVEPEDLENKTDEESKRDLVAMLQMMNQADPAEMMLVKVIKKRLLELMDEPGIVYPDQQVIQPGTPQGGDGGEVGAPEPGLAAAEAGPETTPVPDNLPEQSKAAIENISK